MEVNSKDLYTMRWLLNREPAETDEALGILNGILGASPHEVEDKGVPAKGLKLLRCPFAVTTGLPNSRTRGRYSKGYPEGSVVHFTASHHKRKVEDAIEHQVDKGYTYFLIAPDGKIYQNFPLDRWGYHCGTSKWPGFEDGTNDNFVGIEVMCPGKLDKNRRPWYSDTPFPVDQCRKVPQDEQVEGGWYYRFTPEQESSLKKLILWLHHNNPEVFKLDYVVGHDEVSGMRGLGWRRKNDPGGSLSSTMDEFRASLKSSCGS